MRGLTHRPLMARAAAMLAICLLCSLLSACDGAAGESEPPRRTPVIQKVTPVVMVVGDSFTVGSGPVPAWRTYAAQTARMLGWQPVIAGAGGTGYLNRGRVGRTFQQSFDAELSWRPAPDVLILSGGHNDHRLPTLLVRRAAARLVWEVKGRWPKTRIVMVGPIWLENAPPEVYQVRDALKEVAAREGVPFLDPLARRWVTGRPAETVLPDGVHPTAAGHFRIARWLAQAFRRIS